MALTITIPGAVEATIGATAPAILTVGVGVPGATGATGATGAQGPQGDPGEGVPAGGSAGQVLAKVDGVDYNTEWVNVEGDYLPLAGGAMDANASITIADTSTGTDSEVAGWGLGVQLSADHTKGTTVEFDGLDAYDGASHMQVTPTGITFPDATTQTTAFPGFNDAALTGNPTAPTATFGDNDTSISTTAFVQAALAGGTAVARNLEVQVRNQSGSTIAAGSIVYISGATGNLPLITLSQANNDANSAQTMGFVKTSIANNGTGYVIVRGEVENLNTSALTEGTQLYLSPSTAGTWTTTKPYAPQHLVYVGVVIRSHPTLGTILVAVQNGYELDELHDVAAQTPSNNDLLAFETSTSLWKNKTFSALGLLTSATAASTYAPLASPTFTGTVTIPSGASISGFAPLASPTFTGTPLSTTASVSTNTTQIATTAFVLGQVGTATPIVNGTAAVGTSLLYARQDHVHPTDTTRAALASPTFTGTPLSTTSSIDTNTTQIATTAFVRDMLSDCTWSVPPITTTTTATSGTGSSYVNASPDFGYLQGPNVNLAGYCQKGLQMFARSNSTYGFNYTKEMRIACKMAINWSSTFTGITYTLIQRLGNSGNGALAAVGFGITINMATKVLSILAHNGTTLTTKTTSWAVPFAGIGSVDFMVKHDGTGTVYAYADGVLIDSTTGMSTATSSANTSMFAAVEVNSAGTSSTANATGYISNLRSFVAHG